MDIGTFTSNGTDNMYVGLKQESGGIPSTDRNDAVINWGDNSGVNPLNGPDNLRFIFTETTTGSVPGNPPATDPNGLEIARMVPTLASTLTPPNYGMVGIGDWTTPANIAVPIDAKLDIDGDLRIREVTQQDENRILVIDETDHNRVHFRDISTIALGNYCSVNAANPNPLTGDYLINLNTHNLYLSNGVGDIGMADVPCGTVMPARVFIRNSFAQSPQTVALFVESSTIGTAGVFNGAGIGTDVFAIAGASPVTFGVHAAANGGNITAGVEGTASGAGARNVGVRGVANSPTSVDNFGVMGVANGSSGVNYAGFFLNDVWINGDGYVNGGIPITSDQMFKNKHDFRTF